MDVNGSVNASSATITGLTSGYVTKAGTGGLLGDSPFFQTQVAGSPENGAYVDMTLPSTYHNMGILFVHNNQGGDPYAFTDTTYSVILSAWRTTSVFTVLSTLNGDSPYAFTVSSPSNYVIRITNNGGAKADMIATYIGWSFNY